MSDADQPPRQPPQPPATTTPGERRVSLQVGGIFGMDVRPSRTFVWLGEREEGREVIVSLGSAPKVLKNPGPPHSVNVAGTEISWVGSPVVTVPQATLRAARQAWAAHKERQRRASGG